MKQRNVGIELLRILAMYGVVCLHCLLYGIKSYSIEPFTIGYYVGWILKALAVPSVNCYMLITGYFMVNSKFKLSKLLKLYIQVWVYSVALLFINIDAISLKTLVKHIIPVYGGVYWYASMYIIIYVLSPIINKSISAMTKNELKRAICVMVVCTSVLPILFFFNDRFSLNEGLSVLWLMVVYFTGAYIRLYGISYKTQRISMIYCVLLFILVGGHIIENIINKNSALMGYVPYWYNSPIVYGMAICLFVIFSRIQLECKILRRIVFYVSSCTFGIYLIHEHSNIRELLWSIPMISELQYSRWIGVGVLIICICVFMGCGIVEMLRSSLFKLLRINTLLDTIAQRVMTYLDKIVKD